MVWFLRKQNTVKNTPLANKCIALEVEKKKEFLLPAAH